MDCVRVRDGLDDFVRDALPALEMDAFRAHLAACAPCAAECRSVEALRERAARIPRALEPDHDLWPGVLERIQGGRARRVRLSSWGTFGVVWRAGLAAAALLLVVVGIRETGRSPAAGWRVTALDGEPVVGARGVPQGGVLRPGEWLETDAASRARVDVADIGRVEVGPASAVRLLDTSEQEHRIQLARGELSATIWAPPRLFFVETPSGVAEDLGCRYDLVVDEEGNGALEVTLGFVSFVRDGREVIVPAGARCELRAGAGPGTPYDVRTSPALRDALARLDRDPAVLPVVLEAATRVDAVTLWHLIPRIDDAARRADVVDRLMGLAAPPDGVTREGVIALDRRMLDRWWRSMHPSWAIWN